MVENAVYKAVVTTPNQDEGGGHIYLGLASGLVKLRVSNHYRSFTNPGLRSGCELAKYIWHLKDRGLNDYSIKWEIIATEFTFNRSSGRCQLCIREKLEIMKHMKKFGSKVINKRGELFRKCLHRFKHCLENIDSFENMNIQQEDLTIPNSQEDHNFDSNTSSHVPALSGSTRSGRKFRNGEKTP